MDIVGLLSSDEAELPKRRDVDDFVAYLTGIYDGYRSLIPQLVAPDYISQQVLANQQAIGALCDRILDAVREYERGLPHRAFQHIESAIQAVRPHFERLSTLKNAAATQELRQLYRIRASAPPPSAGFRPGDLFHIPFEARHKVNRQRYSLPGLPCLYLGGTLYICWEELGRPNFDSIYFARFEPQNNVELRYLDFGYTPQFMAATIAENAQRPQLVATSPESDFAVAQAVCWPLLAACSIRRRFGEAPFIAEYVVPQLMLQIITSSGELDGIRYFSVRVDTQLQNPEMACNYVFPARQFASTGHCATLKAKFKLSFPMSWQLTAGSATPTGHPIHSGSGIAFVPGERMHYMQTPFCGVEAKALFYPCTSL